MAGTGVIDIALRRGRDMGPAPASGGVPEPLRISRVAVMAADYQGDAWDCHVSVGDTVRAGQVLCTARRHPAISLVASVAGRIEAVVLGARRSMARIEIAARGDAAEGLDPAPAQNDDAALRALLMRAGLWAAFRTRPFGHVPKPDAAPSAIFVTATPGAPMAPDPALALSGRMDDLRLGVEALLRLTTGPVFVCQNKGAPLVAPAQRLRVARISGPFPAGMAGPQIHRLWPVSRARTVWQIGYQDVAAIGVLLREGRIDADRIVSIAGTAAPTRLVRAPLGARIADLAGESALPPVALAAETPFMGRHDLTLSLGSAPDVPRLLRWIDRLSGPAPAATLPSEAFERIFPFDILPAPLLRALAILDVEAAERLGALELLEEDMALLSWRCPSGMDYGRQLRRVLDLLHDEGVS